MDINSRIDWQAGMEITAQTFRELDDTIVCREQAVTRISHLGVSGILPGSDFSCKGMFVKNRLEIERLACMALLPSGKVLHMDETVGIPVPMLYGDEYFLTVGFGDARTGFDKEGVPFSRPVYDVAVHSFAELEKADLLPLLRFKVTDGVFFIDDEYIPPFLLLESDSRFADYISRFSDKLLELAGHSNLEFGEGQRALQHYYSLLKDYDQRNSVQTFLQLTREIAQTINYYIVRPNTGNPIRMAECSPYDVQAWMAWLEEYMTAAGSILDKVVLEDHSIDFDALKAQIKAELYERLHPELHEELYENIKRELREELNEALRSDLLEYINTRLKAELHDSLHDELTDEIYDSLYKALYDALYKALYVPTEEEKDEFMPVI